MTALERIKEIEKSCVCSKGCNSCSSYKFLLRAFHAMRNIAWEPGNKSTEEIDAMFEERMQGKKS